jgi:Fe-S cluster assembly protein SufD
VSENSLVMNGKPARPPASGETPGDRYRGSLVEAFEARRGALPGAELPWLEAHRRAAIEHFAELGIPTRRHEAWKYTSLDELARTACQPVNGDPHALGGVVPALGPFVSANITRLVFIDGRFTPEHSQIGQMPEGAWVTSLGRILQQKPELVEPHLTGYARYEEHPFVALNTAFMSDGAFVQIPEGSYKELPIHLMYITTPRSRPALIQPRNLIVAAPGSRVSVVEHYVGLDDAAYCTNAVTEIAAGAGATVEHYKLQHESRSAFHLATLELHQRRDSSIRSHSIAEGARLSRHEINLLLAGQGAETALYGLYMMDGERHADHVTQVDHAVPHCTSRQIFKGIMNDAARGVFTGRVVVREDAQKTVAEQMNRNLLLSDKALVESRPQLEIYADDVRCTHGSATGRLDEDAIFYLRSRGIGDADARSLLTYAFASEILRSIRVKLFRTNLEGIFARWLPAGRMLGEIDESHGAPADA